jgi:CRP/FNR family transcriptional regulator, cyclic AMP receptor protein
MEDLPPTRFVPAFDKSSTTIPRESQSGSPAWDKKRALNLLADGYWFRDLAAELRDRIISAGEIREVRRAPLYRIGAKVDGLYATLAGDVRFYGRDEKRGKAFMRALGPTSWFGAVHLMDGKTRRTFEVWCAGPSTLFFLSSNAYRTLIEQSPDAYRAFVRLMCLHTAQVTRMMLDARAEAPARAARALIHLAHAHGRPVERGIEIGIRLSQDDLASLVGVSRQYLNELIQLWARDGLIEWKAKGHHIVDLNRLTGLAPVDERDAIEMPSVLKNVVRRT